MDVRNFIFSSQVYTNARDLARLGLLYLHGGVWNGERLLSREWIDFVRSPAPASAVRGNDYGGQWWLVPDDRDDVPKDAYYFYQSQWTDTPMVHILPHWTHPTLNDGVEIPVSIQITDSHVPGIVGQQPLPPLHECRVPLV